ncbi:MAG: DUF1326 domain-containing protein [Rhodothermia bacterium]|nr:MAG: DUF1326 domain-containing protein [Rhodothermia bacterium]
MTDQWMIRGAEFTNCNCAFGCPCQFNSPSTNGSCEAAVSVQIEEGYFNDTRLDGLCFVMLLQWPGEIAEGNGAFQVIIDEGATPEQREAIRNISTGESTVPGTTHFAVFNSTMSTIHDPLSASIHMSIDIESRQASTTIEGLVNSVGTPLVNPFSGEHDRKRIHLPNGFEYVYAEMASGTTSVTSDIRLDLSESYGQFNILHMNQNGVIRD